MAKPKKLDQGRLDLQDVEAIEARAQAFMEENQELLDDPETSSDVLGRIIVHGTEIATAWYEMVIQPADNRFVAACEDYQDALEDKTLSPKELQERVKAYQAHQADRDKVVARFGDFDAFMTEAQEKYRASLDEDQLAMLEEFGVAEEFVKPKINVGKLAENSTHTESAPEVPKEERPISRSYKPSLWRRFFG